MNLLGGLRGHGSMDVFAVAELKNDYFYFKNHRSSVFISHKSRKGWNFYCLFKNYIRLNPVMVSKLDKQLAGLFHCVCVCLFLMCN